MPEASGGSVSRHALAIALFAALAVAWTWPLSAHLTEAIEGAPGDNYSFVWNFWWMRQVRTVPGLEFFRTTYLFYPFGTSLVDHSHTALPALAGATLLGRLPVVTAHNLILLTFVFANIACMYALAWDLTHHVRAAILAAIVFGTSPYLAAHLRGHFELMAAWVLPLFALLLRRALRTPSLWPAIGAGIVTVVTAYTTYYYVVYLGLLALAYLIAWLHPLSVAWPRHGTPAQVVRWGRRSGRLARARRALLIAIGALAAVAIAIVATGGFTFQIGPAAVSMHRPQNPLAAIWALLTVWAVIGWRPTITRRRLTRWKIRRASGVTAVVTAVFLVGASPLLMRAVQLVAGGEYVTQAYVWRNVPLGVDLLSPFLGHPHHPITGTATRAAYSKWGLNDIEAVGWIGIVPSLLLLSGPLASRRPQTRAPADVRLWQCVGVAFAVLALGPILTVAGFDTGLRLPAILLRYVPFVANARMPGRGMVGVYLALAVLLATRIRSARGFLGRPSVQALIIALVIMEYYDAPIPLTPLDRPLIYRILGAVAPGAVCEVPFGIGDGLSGGIGSQERRALYDATVHEHPLVGGYIGRMPRDAAERYARLPVVGDLLRLSTGNAEDPAVRTATDPALSRSPCDFFVVHPNAGSELRAYVSRLPVRLIAEDAGVMLYQVAPGSR